MAPSVSEPDTTTANKDHDEYLPRLLESARPFLGGELEKVDPDLPRLVSVLRLVGASEC